ncbi:MAG TPA: SDR family oxidoreductase, partial [Kofleriaceae bacterium]
MSGSNGHSNGKATRGYFQDTTDSWGTHSPYTPWQGAQKIPLPELRSAITDKPRIDVTETFRGKHILLIGTTGFVGKVALSMLLHRYPDVGRVYCLVRPGAGNTADERFFRKVATSEAFDPVREVHGANYEAFMRGKIEAVAGDIGRPLCNFTDEMCAGMKIDVIINSAGLVSFMPSLESAIRINSLGAKNVLDLARKLGAKLVHVSTCFVAGQRDGDVWEDEPVVGYFPRSKAISRDWGSENELLDRDFDPAAEIADCQRIIDQARDRSNDRQHISQFRERGAESLRAQKRDPDDEDDLKIAVARERKIWMNDVLTKQGMERARHWGWTNTYTYTKSLGEQIILSDKTVSSTIVRPAIVESAVRFPFSGWNEGFNTSAPLMYLMLKGHRNVPVGEDAALDVIPVDFVCAGMLLATAAVLTGNHEPVYQMGTSDVNRVTSRRVTQLTALAVRSHYRKLADQGDDEFRNRIRARLESLPVTHEHFERFSAPAIKRVADGLIKVIDEKFPKWGAPRLEALAERAREELSKVSAFTGQVNELVELFKPFTTDHDIAFRCDNMRALWARTLPSDQDKLLWAPHLLDWREYWLGSHFPGLQKWTFEKLDEEFGAKPKSVYTYKELIEMFEAVVKLYGHRPALRLLRKVGEDEDAADPITYSYEQLNELCWQGAGVLRQLGLGMGSRAIVMSENRPEWGITWWSFILAGATTVPLDSALTLAEVVNLTRVSDAKVMVLSRKVAERLASEANIALPIDDDAGLMDVWSPAHPALQECFTKQGLTVRVMAYDELLTEPDVSVGAVRPEVKGDTVASLIFTSGTTGTPKGVMLTHKNLTSMVSKLSSLFMLYKHDTLLSVLPLHHTFEFSAGFLMPLAAGASISYLEEI